MNRTIHWAAFVILGTSVSLFAQKRDDAVEVDVDSLQATPAGVSITLRARDSKDAVHMMVGYNEGQSIAQAIGHQEPQRPMSDDLFRSFLDRNGWHVKKVLIRALEQGTFLAEMTMEKDRETQVYDCRPSDGMALGLRYDAKLFVNRQVFEEEKKNTDLDQGDDKKEEDAPSSPEQLTL